MSEAIWDRKTWKFATQLLALDQRNSNAAISANASIAFRALSNLAPFGSSEDRAPPSKPADLSQLILQTVVVPDAKTSEGRLIAAVAAPWFDIIEVLQRDPSAAFQIPPRKWEEIIAGAYKKAGFDEVTLTPRSGDLGRDVIAVKKGIGHVRVIDQVKAFGPEHLVTADDVRALWGVLQGDGASKGYVTTTSDFAPRVRTDPFIAPFIPSRLELINGTALLQRLTELANRAAAMAMKY